MHNLNGGMEYIPMYVLCIYVYKVNRLLNIFSNLSREPASCMEGDISFKYPTQDGPFVYYHR